MYIHIYVYMYREHIRTHIRTDRLGLSLLAKGRDTIGYATMTEVANPDDYYTYKITQLCVQQQSRRCHVVAYGVWCGFGGMGWRETLHATDYIESRRCQHGQQQSHI